MKRPCQECGKPIQRRGSRNKFCHHNCYLANAKKKGPNSGAFKKGIDNSNLSVPVGTVTIRTHKKDGKRAWQKVAQPSVWKLRAVVVWESVHGPLPQGKLIHHRDRDSLHDVITNLQALTRAEHLAEHRKEFGGKFRKGRRDPVCVSVVHSLP